MIYDLCIFFNELPTLELRLRVLHKKVDRFIIVEANETFTGKPKEYLAFDLIQSMPEEIRSKIKYYPISFNTSGAWNREHEQRNALSLGLEDFTEHDYAILADVDEIPNPDKLDQAIAMVDKHNSCLLQLTWLQQRATLQQIMNRDLSGRNNCQSTFMFNKKLLDSEGTLQRVRNYQGGPTLVDAGWHFSSMGGPMAVKEKITSFAHTEYANDKFVGDEINTRNYEEKRDFLQRTEFSLIDYPEGNLPPEIFNVNNHKEFFGV